MLINFLVWSVDLTKYRKSNFRFVLYTYLLMKIFKKKTTEVEIYSFEIFSTALTAQSVQTVNNM